MYTIEQRLKIYQQMLSESLSPTEIIFDNEKRSTKENGFCWMYRLLYQTTDLYGRFEELLPELYEKATTTGTYMWNNWDEREKALAECIVELQTAGGIV